MGKNIMVTIALLVGVGWASAIGFYLIKEAVNKLGEKARQCYITPEEPMCTEENHNNGE